ncbi:MAG: cell division protein ZapA [Bacteroidales bacterium]
MEEKLSIRVALGDRYYALKIVPSEEEKIRKTAAQINEKVQQYRKQFVVGKDMQDWLSMVCLFFALKEAESQASQEESTHLENLQNLERKLTEYLDYAGEDV